MLRTVTRLSTVTFIYYSRSIFSSWGFFFKYLRSPFPTFPLLVLSVLLVLYFFSYFPLLSLSLSVAICFVYLVLVHPHCSSITYTDTVSHLPSRSFTHVSLSILQKYLYALTLHNRRSPTYATGVQFLLDHVIGCARIHSRL